MKHPFTAVAIRYVHDPRTEEFLNIGLVLFCEGHRFAGARFLSRWGRVTSAFSGADLPLLRRMARSIERACEESALVLRTQLELDPVRDVHALIRTAIHLDDASIQCSPALSGLTADAERTLAELFALYVPESEDSARRGRDDSDVRRVFSQRFTDAALLRKLQPKKLTARHLECSFDYSWKNGHWNVAQPLSLDLIEPRAIRDKATNWVGRLLTLRPDELDVSVHLVVGMPGRDSSAPVREAARDALAILENTVRSQANVLTEDECGALVAKIEADLRAHEDPREG